MNQTKLAQPQQVVALESDRDNEISPIETLTMEQLSMVGGGEAGINIH